MASKWWRELRQLLLTLIGASLLFLGVHTYLAEARVITSGSMLPTIGVGDRVLVEKVTHHFAAVHRLDVIVFAPPASARATEDYIKRVIGLPGDTVEIAKGQVLVNGEPLDEKYLVETTGGQFGPVTVPPDCLFVMGDNRNSSFDSRSWGMVPLENVKGRALFRYYPFFPVERFAIKII